MNRLGSKRQLTLALRLLIRVGLTMLAALAVLAVVVMLIFQSHLDSLQDRSLLGQADDLRRALVEDTSTGRLQLNLPPGLARQYAESPQSARYAVLSETGDIFVASKGVSTPLDPILPGDSDQPVYFRFTDPVTGQVLIGVSICVEVLGRTVVIQAAQGMSHNDVLADGLFDELADEAGWAILTVFALVLGILYWTVQRTLIPLQRASHEAALVGPDAPDARVSTDDLPGELRSLVSAINRGVDRLQRAYAMQKEFTDNAAHELRTPIAVLRAHLDTLPKDRTVATLSRQVGVLERIVDQLLRLARLEGERIATQENADLVAVARSVAEMMAPQAVQRGVDLSLEAQDRLPVHGRPALLEMACRNLVENAIKAAGKGGCVRLSVLSDPTPCLLVEDSGPGVPEAEHKGIFARFARSDRVASEGAGLGLSIVARIAELHGATVRIDRAALGGASFRMAFPESPTQYSR